VVAVVCVCTGTATQSRCVRVGGVGSKRRKSASICLRVKRGQAGERAGGRAGGRAGERASGRAGGREGGRAGGRPHATQWGWKDAPEGGVLA
jgi:hypothetical protein